MLKASKKAIENNITKVKETEGIIKMKDGEATIEVPKEAVEHEALLIAQKKKYGD
jgi:hypothetical protein